MDKPDVSHAPDSWQLGPRRTKDTENENENDGNGDDKGDNAPAEKASALRGDPACRDYVGLCQNSAP